MALGLSNIAAAESLQTLDYHGTQRSFLAHDFSAGKSTALVIVLHGGGGNAKNAAEQTQFDRVAQREKLIAVYPNGNGRLNNKLLAWNAGHCCAYAMQSRSDDIGFISALIDHLLNHYSIDPNRVYITGLSNGGMMTHQLGIALSNKLAAIAPVIGAVFGDESAPARALPAVIINGAVDTIVPPTGGTLNMNSDLGPLLRRILQKAADKPVLPAGAQAKFWANANGCKHEQTSKVSGAELTRYDECRNNADVLFYSVTDNGHAWPGGKSAREGAAKPSITFDANEAIWAFFTEHIRKADTQ
ncbi:MAG: PHB depolymerase family esterase [Steroidobacteraceae bacterium]